MAIEVKHVKRKDLANYVTSTLLTKRERKVSYLEIIRNAIHVCKANSFNKKQFSFRLRAGLNAMETLVAMAGFHQEIKVIQQQRKGSLTRLSRTMTKKEKFKRTTKHKFRRLSHMKKKTIPWELYLLETTVTRRSALWANINKRLLKM